MLLIDYSHQQQHQQEQTFQQPVPQQQQQPLSAAQSSVTLSRNAPSASVSAMRSINDDITRDSSSPSIPGSAVATPSAPDTSSSSKKVLVMKRQAPSNTNNNKASDNKPSITAEDREKAYLEARARIFGTTGGGDETATTGNDDNRVDSRNESRTDSPSLPVPSNKNNIKNINESSGNITKVAESGNELAQTLFSKNDGGSGKFGRSSSGSSLSSQQSGSGGAGGERDDEGGQQQPSLRRIGSNQRVQSMNNSNNFDTSQDTGRNAGSGRGKGKLVDVGSWVGSQNKSQLRNIEAEKSDPDFVRRGSPNVSGGGCGSASSAAYSASASSNYDAYGYNQYGNNSGYGGSPRGDVCGSGGGYPQYAGYTNYPTNAYGQPIPPPPTLTIGNYGYPPQGGYMNDLYQQQQGSTYGYNQQQPMNGWTQQQLQQYQQQQQYKQQRGNNSPYERGTNQQNPNYGNRNTGGNNSDVCDSNEFPPLA
jgi:hypothetical protein